jgi:lysophospholipase L1-like esterase
VVRRAALLLCAAAAVGGLGASRTPAADGSTTLGVSTVGDLSVRAVSNYLDASGPYALAAAGTLTKLTGYISGGSVAFPMRAVVYADSGGAPGALVAVSSEVTIAPSQAAGWVDFPFPAGVAVAPGGYWLGYWFGASGASFVYTSVAGSERYVQAAYSSTGSPPASYGSASTSASSYSLYATLGSSGGGSPPASTALPAVSGTAQQGQTLGASTGSWSNGPTSYAYRWERCDSSGGSCAAISGATGTSYLLQSADVGATVRVAVTATNASGSSQPAESPATAVVTAAGGGGGGGSTFGQTAVGSATDSGGAGYLDVSGPYAVGAVSISKLTAYVAGGSSTSRIRGVVYADAGGAPGALQAVTPEVSIPAGQAAGWLDLPFSSAVSLPAGSYWLGYWYADSASRHYYVSSSGSERYAPAAYSSAGSPPGSFGSAGTSASSYSLYATVGSGGGGGGSPPANTALPAISGTAQQGQTLSASTGSWSNSPTSYAYQWQRCASSGGSCSAISGATGTSYLLQSADVGATIRVAVTATNASGSAAATSAAAGPVAAASTGLPSSLAALGDSLTRGYGAGGAGQDYPAESWSTGTDSSVASVYLRLLGLDAAISGRSYSDAVSGSTMSADVSQAATAVSQGAQLVTVWAGTNDVCTPTTAQMTSVASFTSSLQSTLSELTSHLAGVQVLVVSIPDWYGFWQAYQANASAESAWAAYSNRCPDLLSSSATPAARSAVQQRISDLNAAIVGVCAQFAGCRTDSGAVFRLWPGLPAGDFTFDWFHLTSAGQAAVAAAAWAALPWSGGAGPPPASTAPPAISGSAQQGQTLAASTGSWTNGPTAYAYQWQDCNAAGGACAPIAGAAGSSYLLQAADVGHTIEVAVTASNASGNSSPALSPPTAVVAAAGGGGGGTTVGQTSAGTLIDGGGAGYLDVSGPYAVSSAGTLSALTAYVAGGGSASRIRGVVYADAGGTPGALVAATTELSIGAAQAAGWVALPFAAAVSLPAGSYWLGYWYADSSSRHYYASVTGAERYAAAPYSSTASPPSSFPAAHSSSSSYSLYGTLTAP